MHVCQTLLNEQIKRLGPYSDDNVFYEKMARDFLKDNDYAVLYDLARDQKKPVSRKVYRKVDSNNTQCTYTIQRYQKVLTFRCFFWAPDQGILEGILREFEQNITEIKRIPDSNGVSVKVILDDVVRSQEKRDRRLRRPEMAIIRINFEGGLFVRKSNPIIQNVNVQMKED